LATAVVVAASAAVAYYYVCGPGSCPVVRTARAVRGDLRAELSATGVVKAEQVTIASEAPARIERIAVRENDQVRRGQVLVLLDRESLEGYLRQAQAQLAGAQAQQRQAEQAVAGEELNARGAMDAARANLRAAQAQLERLERGARPEEIRVLEARARQAQAQLKQTESDLARAQALYKEGAVAEQALDQAGTAVKVASEMLSAAEQDLGLARQGARSEDIEAARAQVEAARAGMRQASALGRVVEMRRREAQAARSQVLAAQSQVRVASAEANRAEIRAPLDATVVRVDAKAGEVAYPGVALMALADLSRMWVEAEIDDVDLDKVKLGQEVTVRAEAFPGQEFRGRVFEISRSAEPKLMGRVRAKIVRAKVRLLDAAPLTAEMEVDVASRPVVARSALLVPNQALGREGDRSYVYVVNGDRVRRTPVRVGQRNFERTQILDRLREGEAVALIGDTPLRDGERVRVARGM
jgi:HlyD family secretion protein